MLSTNSGKKVAALFAAEIGETKLKKTLQWILQWDYLEAPSLPFNMPANRKCWPMFSSEHLLIYIKFLLQYSFLQLQELDLKDLKSSDSCVMVPCRWNLVQVKFPKPIYCLLLRLQEHEIYNIWACTCTVEIRKPYRSCLHEVDMSMRVHAYISIYIHTYFEIKQNGCVCLWCWMHMYLYICI